MPFHGGPDRGGTRHAVCVVGGTGQVVVRLEAQHDDAGLADMLARLMPACDEIHALRASVRIRDDLVASRLALANPLRILLEDFWPGAAAIHSRARAQNSTLDDPAEQAAAIDIAA